MIGAATLNIIDLVSDNQNKKYEPVGRMAAEIIEIYTAKGSCLPQDLYAKGYRSTDISDNWHMAQAIAAIEMKLVNDLPARPVMQVGR